MHTCSFISSDVCLSILFLFPPLSICVQASAPARPHWSSVSNWPRGPACCSTGQAVDIWSLTRSPWWRPASLINWSLSPGEILLSNSSVLMIGHHGGLFAVGTVITCAYACWCAFMWKFMCFPCSLPDMSFHLRFSFRRRCSSFQLDRFTYSRTIHDNYYWQGLHRLYK